MKKQLMLAVLLTGMLISIGGCKTVGQCSYFLCTDQYIKDAAKKKLNRPFDWPSDMLNINSQIGACVGYNSRLFNGVMFRNERLYQQLNGMPNSRTSFQQIKKIRSKYGL